MYLYAFDRINEPDGDEKIIYLTAREFDIFFSSSPPSVVRKALAYSKFTMLGERMQRVPFAPRVTLPDRPTQ